MGSHRGITRNEEVWEVSRRIFYTSPSFIICAEMDDEMATDYTAHGGGGMRNTFRNFGGKTSRKRYFEDLLIISTSENCSAMRFCERTDAYEAILLGSSAYENA